MTLGTIVIAGVLAIALFFSGRKIVRDKKAGVNLQCGIKCSECTKHCH